jgi:hypothetical protein
MGYVAKHKFYCDESKQHYDIGDGYITIDREKERRLYNLGFIEYSERDAYEVKVIKTRGRVHARQRPDTAIDHSN